MVSGKLLLLFSGGEVDGSSRYSLLSPMQVAEFGEVPQSQTFPVVLLEFGLQEYALMYRA